MISCLHRIRHELGKFWQYRLVQSPHGLVLHLAVTGSP